MNIVCLSFIMSILKFLLMIHCFGLEALGHCKDRYLFGTFRGFCIIHVDQFLATVYGFFYHPLENLKDIYASLTFSLFISPWPCHFLGWRNGIISKMSMLQYLSMLNSFSCKLEVRELPYTYSADLKGFCLGVTRLRLYSLSNLKKSNFPCSLWPW